MNNIRNHQIDFFPIIYKISKTRANHNHHLYIDRIYDGFYGFFVGCHPSIFIGFFLIKLIGATFFCFNGILKCFYNFSIQSQGIHAIMTFPYDWF